MTDKKRYALLDVLRTLAILLVLNSHFDPLYPIPALATGGAVGNGLFFILSGYCLTLRPTFLRHMGIRTLRLYPGVLISVFVQLLIGMKEITNVTSAFSQLIWPTAFWFVGAIILFDALLYWLNKLNFTDHFGLFSLAMAALYTAAYLLFVDKTVWSVEDPGLRTPQQCFKLIYCFYIYALGYTLKIRGIPAWTQRHTPLLISLTTGLFLFSFGFKLILNRFPSTMPLQFLTQISIIGFTSYAVCSALILEEWWMRVTTPRLRRGIAMFSSISLEMYLVQFPFISICSSLPFPMNVAVIIPLVVICAFVLHTADTYISRRIMALIPQKKG